MVTKKIKIGVILLSLIILVGVLGVVSAANTIESSTLHFSGDLTPDGSGGYTGTIPATAGTYYTTGGTGCVGDMTPDGGSCDGGFDVYAKEDSCAYVLDYYSTGEWNCDGIDTTIIGSDHDAYAEGGPWGAWWGPDCADWYAYSLELTEDHWYLRYTATQESPMSGTMNWDTLFAAETDKGTLDGNDNGDLNDPEDGIYELGGPQMWDWNAGAQVERIPLEYAGFQVGIENTGGDNYIVTMIPAPDTNPVITNVYTDPAYPNLDSNLVNVYASIADSDGIDYATLIYQIGDEQVEDTDFSSPLLGYAVISNPHPTDGILVKYRIKTADDLGNIGWYPSQTTWKNFTYDDSEPSVSVGGAPSQYLVDPAGVDVNVICEDPYSGCDVSSYGLKFYLDDNGGACSNTYTDYTNTSPVIGYNWVCAVAKDNAGHTGFSPSPVEFTVFSTIQEGIDAVAAGGTINVAEGEYSGAIINKDVNVYGSEGAIITSGVLYKDGSSLETAFRLDADADGTEIRDFTINCNQPVDFYFAVFSRAADDVIIDSLTVNDAVQGITNYGGDNWQITNNVLTDTVAAGGGGIGIYLGVLPPDYTTLHGNIIQNNVISADGTESGYTSPGISMAIDARGTTYDDLTGNEDISNNQILGNTIIGTGNENEVGIEVGVIGLGEDPDKISAMLGKIHDNLIQDNIVDGSDWGVYFYTVTNLMVKNNEIKNCNEGIHIKDGNKDNSVNYNDIYNNANYGINNTATSTIDAKNNWWGHITGPYHLTNTDGQGNDVSDNVDYRPWWITETGGNDVTFPESEITLNGALYYNVSVFDLPYNTSDDYGLLEVRLYENEVDIIYQDISGYPLFYSGSFSRIVPSDGVYQYYTRAVDIVDNVEDVPTEPDVTIIVDTTAPTINITAPYPNGALIDAMAYYSVRADVEDKTSGVKNVTLVLINSTDDVLLDNILMTNGTYGYEYNMRMWELEAGDYTLEVTAEDNAGNSATDVRTFIIEDNIAPTKIISTNNKVPVETGGIVSFDFNVTVRGNGSIKFGMDDIAGLTPSQFNARIVSNPTAAVGGPAPGFVGAEVLSLEDLDPTTPNVQGSFTLYLDIPKDMIPGTYSINYYIDVA